MAICLLLGEVHVECEDSETPHSWVTVLRSGC